MHAVDTNVVVRFLTGDDPAQAEIARSWIGQRPIFVPRTVMLEAEWVLRSVYDLPAARVIAGLRALAGLPGVTVEDAPLVSRAMAWADGGMDFADALHLAASRSCAGLVTFDKAMSRAAPGRPGVPVILA